jgi:hypothetical protein
MTGTPTTSTPATDPALFDPAPLPADAPGDAVEAWTASEYARGPWDPRHCHGGPVSALLARACEQAPTGDTDWLITRLTIELTRPVPVGRPLALSTVVERPGRKVSVVAASLSTDGIDVAKVRALRVRRRDFALPEHPLADPEMDGTPGEGRHEKVSWAADGATIAFHSHSVEHRIVTGSWNDPGPIQLWIRLSVPLVAGETPTGVQRAAAAADFGNGVSSAIDYDQYLFINPDLTVHLAREPAGEWIGLSAHSVYGTPTASSGAGFAESALHDELGRVGRSVQSLFVEPR